MGAHSTYKSPRGQPLTRKQHSIMTLVVDGLKPHEIGERNDMAPSTVSTHLARACAKLGARSVEQAAVLFDRQLRVLEPKADI